MYVRTSHSSIVKHISRIPNLKAREPTTLLHIHILPLGMGTVGKGSGTGVEGREMVRECGKVSFVNISYSIYSI